MKPRLLTALCAGLLGLLALLPDAQAEESCASIIARAEYPQGREITATFPITPISRGATGYPGISRHFIYLDDTIRIPADAPGPITLVARLTHDLPLASSDYGGIYKTDIPGIGLGVTGGYARLGEPFTLQPGQSLGKSDLDKIQFQLFRLSDLVPGNVDLTPLPGVKLECMEEGAASAWVVRLSGGFNIYNPTCEAQQDQVVDLGEHPASRLARAGDSTPWVDFTLHFSNCQNFYGPGGITFHEPNGYMYKHEKHSNSINVGAEGENVRLAWSRELNQYLAVRLDDSSSWEPLQIDLRVMNWNGRPHWSYWGRLWTEGVHQTEYSLPMRARYYRSSDASLEPGPKTASVVLTIRYE